MAIYLSTEILKQLQAQGEESYPEEGAGLILGLVQNEHKHVFELVAFRNAREEGARRNRYLLTPKDYLVGEQEAERLGLDVIGVFHSHPDHPDQPSEFDREHAIPLLSYIITSVRKGDAVSSRSWMLSEDRDHFNEEPITITDHLSIDRI